MSATSSPLKPFASSPAASLDSVAFAIAEADVELSSEHALFRSSEIPAKRVASIFSRPEPLMEEPVIRDRFDRGVSDHEI